MWPTQSPRNKTVPAVDACPVGWLLEALAGHRLDWLLFPRRSLRWRYHPRLWVILENATTLDGLQIPCDCFRTNRQPYPLEHLPKSDMIARFSVASLSAAVVRRHCLVTARPVGIRRRIPPGPRTLCHECLFWAGPCSECGTIHWTLSPWVERPEGKHEALHREHLRAR